MSPDPPSFLDHIDRMTGYVPGAQPRERNVVKLNTNENPYPPSPLVLTRLRQACDGDLRRYPDAAAAGIRKRLSDLFDAPAGHFVIGNGSDELLNVILRSFAGAQDLVVLPTPTYPYYSKLIELQGARVRTAPLRRDFSLDLDALVQPGARVTILANPNSPTGIGLSPAQIDEVAGRVQGILVVDEAYVDFAPAGAIDVARRHRHVIVTRTLSKSFSLAGIRVGFCYADAGIAAGLWKVKEHYNVSRLSQVAAEAALDDIDWMRANARRVVATRQRLTERLRSMRFDVWDSQANFVLARVPGGDAGHLHERLQAQGYLVRYFGSQPRLADCLRISIGTDAEIDGLLQAVQRLLSAS